MFAALEEHQDDVMFRWIITTLPQKDEEVTMVHVPVMLDHLVQSAKVSWHERLYTSAENQDGHTMTTTRLIALALDLYRHAARGLLSQAAMKSTDSHADIASGLYSADNADVESYRQPVVDQAIPRTVRNIFDLAVRPKLSANDQLAVLELVSWSMDAEASTIGTIVGTNWLRCLVAQLASVRHHLVETALLTIGQFVCRCRCCCGNRLASKPVCAFQAATYDQPPHHHLAHP
jgi:hypothetical protein